MSNKDKEPTWGHLPKLTREEPFGRDQRLKWLCAAAKAPSWKVEEYLGQYFAWAKYEEEKEKLLSPDWCNPLARA